MEGGIEGFYRYVTYERVGDFEAHGWRISADLGRHHGQWAVLMRWAGHHNV